MPIKPDPNSVFLKEDADEWHKESSLQHAYGLYLEAKGYEVDLEVSINIGGERKRIDIMAYAEHETLMIEAKPKLSDRGAFIACGQLSTYSKALHADRFIVLVGIAEHDGAIATIESNDVNGTDVELEIYSPADDRQLNPEPSDNYDHEPAYAAAYSHSYKPELSPGMIGFGIVAVIVLGFLGMIGNSTSGGNSGPVQRVSNPDVVRAGSALVVTPKTGNCQPLRTQPNQNSQSIDCVFANTQLRAIADEQNGWVLVSGSANGDGWLWYEGVTVR